MGKYLKQGVVRELEYQLNKEEISYSKWVELMEEECIKNYKAETKISKMIKEEELLKLGFERVDVSKEESGDKGFHYYTYDIGHGVISLITQSNDEIENDDWHVEVFNDTSIRFETIEDVTKFIQVTEKNIVR